MKVKYLVGVTTFDTLAEAQRAAERMLSERHPPSRIQVWQLVAEASIDVQPVQWDAVVVNE